MESKKHSNYLKEGNIIRRAPKGTEICPSAQDSHPQGKIYNGTSSQDSWLDYNPKERGILQQEVGVLLRKWMVDSQTPNTYPLHTLLFPNLLNIS